MTLSDTKAIQVLHDDDSTPHKAEFALYMHLHTDTARRYSGLLLLLKAVCCNNCCTS